MAGRGHELIDDKVLAQALRELAAPPREPAATAACATRLDADIAAQLDAVAALAAARSSDEASILLVAVDKRHGGLAAPRSLALAARLAMP